MKRTEQYARFPLFVSMEGRRILFFGAGEVAARRIDILLKYGAKIEVVAPGISEKKQKQFAEWIKAEKIHYCKKVYEEGDLQTGVQMVFAATNNKEINEEITAQCKRRRIPVNNASNPMSCDFFFPSVIQEEGIIIGITGDGKNHGKVKKVRKKIEEWIRREKKEEAGCL
nr:NAD(P)-dependent oxidoreductase [uncultured Sellimonas sp.]